jgi:16S rRNA (guanine966-N2)-methyltransferase
MRIVAGKWRGRTLRAPRGMAVRPTTDRVRESIFDILGDRVPGRSVLDLFAGTGALAIEALSRGAASAVLVEPDIDAAAAIRGNLDAVGAEGAELLRMDFRRAIRRLSGSGRAFDLVFLDPPYGKGIAAQASLALSGAGMLSPGALVVVEEAARAAEAGFPGEWEISVDRRYGDTRVTVFDVV